MKVKRLLSAVLILCMTFSLLSGISVNVGAANTVSYTRYGGPEVAILNYFTGGQSEFYETILKDGRFNAVQAGKFVSGGDKLQYDTNNGKTKTFTWSNFVGSRLAFLSDQAHQLKVNYSATLKNNIHEHSWKASLFTKYVQECYGRMSAQLWFNGAVPRGMNGPHYSAQYSDNSKRDNVRKGDMNYAEMPEVFNGHQVAGLYMVNGEYVYDWAPRSDLNLSFTNHDYYYDSGNKTCTCGGWVNSHFVGFYDGEAPYVKSVETRLNGVPTSDFKPGDVAEIVLKMSEPIRFADDSATGKENISIALLVNGSTTPRYADLKALTSDGVTYIDPHSGTKSEAVWELVFAYEVSADNGKLLHFTGVDLSRAPTGKTALVHSDADIALKQLVGNSAFTVSKPAKLNSREGIDRTKSFVTDMAGNALQKASPAANFTVDAQQPFVAKTVVNAVTNNDNVKAGKKPEDANWIDNSDSYLGVGDSFTLTLYLNEVVHYAAEQTSPAEDLALVTLNLLNAGGDPVTLPVYRYRLAKASDAGDQYGLGASGGYVTVLASGRIRLQDGMHLPDGESTLVINSIEYYPAQEVRDASANPARNEYITDTKEITGEDNHLTPSAHYHVDTVGPTVTLGAAAQNGANTPFSVSFTVTDGAGGSGVQEMVGSIRLTAADGEAGAYQYAVSTQSVPDDKTVWQDARFGDALPFTEPDGEQFLHVRPVDGEIYNFGSLTTRFTLSDYAGNIARRELTLENVYFDNIPATLNSGSATRAYDNVNNHGVMTVPVTGRDASGFKTVSCLWADDPEAEITETSDGWQPLVITQGEKNLQTAVTVTLENGNAFSKTLWLKAEDMAGNKTLVKKSAYSYSLEALAYHLDYTTAVTTEATILSDEHTIEQEDGVIVVDVRKAGDVDEDSKPIHYINVGMRAGFNNGFDNIFGGGFCWYKATLDETDGRSFTILPGQGEGVGLLHDYIGGYSGEIEVTVYSGTTQSIQVKSFNYNGSIVSGKRWYYNSQTTPITMDNSVGVEHFRLRVVPKNDNLINNANNARIKCSFTYVDPRLHSKNPAIRTGQVNTGAGGIFGYYETNKSLAGATLSFTLTDTYGWDFDDIDWDNSYLRLSNYWGDWYENDPTAVRICGIGKGPVQTVTIPACSLPNGRYENIKLALVRYSCPSDPYWFYVRDDVTETGHAQYVVSDVDLDVDIDGTEPGTLQPGLLSYQPYTKLFDYTTSNIRVTTMEMSASAFPRRLIDYDPNDVIYIPAGLGRVDMMFRVLDAEGAPALLKGYVTNYNRNFGQYDVVAWNTADPSAAPTYLQNYSSLESTEKYYDRDYLDTYCFRLNDEGQIESWQNAGEEGGQLCLSFTMGDRNTVSDAYGGHSQQLRLTPDQDNVIAVQTRYVNGETSDVVYLTVHPVSPETAKGVVTVEPAPENEDANHPWGTIVGAPGEVSYRYTPADGERTAGLTFYLCEGYSRFLNSESGITHSYNGETWQEHIAVENPTPMTLQDDGTYLAPVPLQDGYQDAVGGLRHYVVVAEDAMGNLTVLPGPQNSVVLDTMGPMVDGESEVNNTGSSFATQFYVSDESLMACVSRWISGSALAVPTGGPMELTFSVDEAYAALTGADSFTVLYDPAEAEASGTVTYENGTWHKTVVTELPVAGNKLGITSVTATLEAEHGKTMAFGMNRYVSLKLDVRGNISPKLTAAGDVTLTLTAKDCYGNATYTYYNTPGDTGDSETHPSSASTVLHNAAGEPAKFVSAEYKLTGNTTYGYSQDRALYMTFTSPVRPVESWICPNPTGFATEWHDAFPIWKDGEWEISYYDLNEVLHTETITLTDVFGEYGIDLEFSATDYTKDPIVITASAEGTSEHGHSDSLLINPRPADGQTFQKHGSYVQSTDSITVEENGDYVLLRGCYAGDYGRSFTDASFRDEYVDYLPIHIGNYANGRPEENVTLLFHDTGRPYAAGAPDQRTGETDDMVTLSYRTERPTQPVGSGETAKTFRAGEDDSFSFTYYDPVMDQEYTLSGTLSGTYGVTLVAPADPPADESAPDIGRVTVWRQIGNRFEPAEAFRGDASDAVIADVFSVDRTGLAQGYDLVVTATDASAWKLLLCEDEPTALSYDAQSAAIPGVTVQGNNVLITSEVASYAGDAFRIAAVDAHGNFSFFKLMKSWFAFDTTAPEITCSEPQISNFYERIVFVKALDKDNLGNDTGDVVTVVADGLKANDDSVAAYPAADWPWMIVFTENTTGNGVPVTATDVVGNHTITYVTMDGIDSSVPTLSVTWSPCFRGGSGLDQTAPTQGPVNVDVVAHITSDKSIAAAEGSVTLSAPEYPAFTQTYDLPYGAPMGTWMYPDPVSYVSNDKMVTVYFTTGKVNIDKDNDGYPDELTDVSYHVVLKVYAPNRGYSEAVLDLASGVVDKEPPETQTENYTYLYHQRESGGDYPVAYAYQAALTFSEDVYLGGDVYEGAPGELHRASDGFTCTVYDEDIHTIVMTDRAGNVNGADLIPNPQNPVDNDAPRLSLLNEDELKPVTSGSVTVNVRIDDASDMDSLTVSDPTHVTVGAVTQQTDSENNTYGLLPLTVNYNGTYRLTAIDQAGNVGTMTFSIGSLDRTLPVIRFTTGTVSLRQGAAPTELQALLDDGVSLWDNTDDETTLRATLSYDSSVVKLNVPGVYSVAYTVTDSAGNVGQSVRMVRVLSEKLPEIRVDGMLTELNGTFSLRPGEHTLTVGNLGSANEPYTVKLVKGIWSEGQLKYVTGGISVGAGGSFTLSAEGYYTLYILTQSRMSYRTLLYAAN